MDMVRLNSEFSNIPSFFRAFLLDQFNQAILDGASEDRFPALWTPDQVIDDQVDAVLIPLVFHCAGRCRFHGTSIQQNQQNGKNRAQAEYA